jgi:hypothetical protein
LSTAAAGDTSANFAVEQAAAEKSEQRREDEKVEQ